MLTKSDQDLRQTLAVMIAELGYAPSSKDLAERTDLSVEEVETALVQLHEAHVLLLHPDTFRPWAVHPFALSAGLCWVQTPSLGYWANCLYCAFGIAAALKCDAVISTRIAGEAEPVTYEIRNGMVLATDDVFHLTTPVAQWWDNVIAACASFQPFHSEIDVVPWCARHGFARGHVMSISQLWAFAQDWYGGHLQPHWRKRSLDETRALFLRHDLTSPFWNVANP